MTVNVTGSAAFPDAPGRGLRVAFAGAGHWHFLVDAQYLELAREAGLQVVGLSDDDEQVARQRAELAGCPWTTDLSTLVERFKPNFVIATPRPDRAAEQVRALLGYRVPLFAEKPLGLRADEVWPLVEPAERGWVTVAFPNRCLPIWGRLEQLRADGRLGTIGHVGGRLLKGSPARYVDFGVPWMLDPKLGGGGPLRNFGIHLADLLRWQLGADKTEVVGVSLSRRMHEGPIEDFATAVLRTETGVVVNLEVGYSLASITDGDFELRVAANGAYLVQHRDRLEIRTADGSLETVQHPPAWSAYRALFRDALHRLRRGDPPLAGVRDCALANDLVDAMYDAAVV